MNENMLHKIKAAAETGINGHVGERTHLREPRRWFVPGKRAIGSCALSAARRVHYRFCAMHITETHQRFLSVLIPKTLYHVKTTSQSALLTEIIMLFLKITVS